jgi:hypothetical protein
MFLLTSPDTECCRVSTTVNHFIPTEMDKTALDFIASPLRGVAGARPVTSTHPLVEVGVITAAGFGTALPCINWSGGEQPQFALTLHFPVKYTHATLASGGHVAVSGGNRSTFSFALSETIDALILR